MAENPQDSDFERRLGTVRGILQALKNLSSIAATEAERAYYRQSWEEAWQLHSDIWTSCYEYELEYLTDLAPYFN